MDSKRAHGRYFTSVNPFNHPAFLEWAESARITHKIILEPFAGTNNLIRYLLEMGLCRSYMSFDIMPAAADVLYRDTLSDFPAGYEVCVTNPPWLAKNLAKYRGLSYPATTYDDVYKLAVEKCLVDCAWVAVLVPESFIRAGLFQERLIAFVSLTSSLFVDTSHPVGLALFGPETVLETAVWSGDEWVGVLSDISASQPQPVWDGCAVTFNVAAGNVGLIALDNTIGPSIRFCDVEELRDYDVKDTSRHITKLLVDGDVRIDAWNEYLNAFRVLTQDVLLTSYRGVRKDGKYRRRLDWNTARGIIHNT